MEVVELITYDGLRLSANLYLPVASGWSPAILVCHGFGSRKENHAGFAEMAASEGFASLIMDLRGHGESEGSIDGNVFNDVAAGLAYLQGRPEVNPTRIAVRGSSMGAWLAVHTAARLPDLWAVVAFCPVSELFMTNIAEEAGMVQRGHASPSLAAITATMPKVDVNSLAQLLYRLDISRSVGHISPRPLLIVHAEGDEVVPVHISEKL